MLNQAFTNLSHKKQNAKEQIVPMPQEAIDRPER